MASQKTQNTTSFSFEGKTVEELLAFQQQLQEAVEAKKTETRDTDLAEAKRLIEFHGFSLEDLGFEVHPEPAKRGRKPGSVAKMKKEGGMIAYSHPQHGTWSGKGRNPLWVVAARKDGTLDQYAVKPAPAPAEVAPE